MEKEIILKLKLDTSESVDNVEKVEEAIKGIGKNTEGINKLEGSIKSARTQLREYMNQMTAMADKGSAEYQALSKKAGELKDKMGDAQKAIQAYASDTKKLDLVVQGFSAIGNAAQVAMGAAALFGDENEEVTKSIQKMVAIQSVMNGVQQLGTTLTGDSILVMKAQSIATKAQSAATAAYSAIVGTSTGAMKLFKIALASTGIGLIIVAIVSLIANFESVSNWVSNIGEKFKWLKPSVDAVKKSFDDYSKALQAMGIIDDEATKKKKELIAGMDKLLEKIGGNYDFEISKAKAAGKNTFELEQQKRNAIIETLKVHAQAIYEAILLEGSATKEQKEQLDKIVKLARDNYREMAVAKIAENKKSNDEIEKNNKTAADNYKKKLEDEAAAKKKLEDEAAKLLEQQQAIGEEIRLKERERNLSETNFKISEIDRFYKEKYKLAEGDAVLTAALDAEVTAEKQAVKDEADKKNLETELNNAIALRELKLQLKQEMLGELPDNPSPEELKKYYEDKGIIEDDQFALDQEKLVAQLATEQLTQEQFKALDDLLDAQHTNKKKAIAKEESDYKKNLKKLEGAAIQDIANQTLGILASGMKEGSKEAKAMAVAQATMSTWQGANAAYTSAAASPVTIGFPGYPAVMAGLAVAAGIMNVKKIIQTPSPAGGGGGGGGISAPTITSPSMNVPASNTGGGFNPNGTSTNNLLPSTPTPPTVTVLESDIKRATDNNSKSIEMSEL